MNRRSTYGLSSVKLSTAFAAKKQSSSYFVREKRDCRRSITTYAPLRPIWDILVQNLYAGKNSLDGLHCCQNHILCFKNVLRKCEN